MTRAHTAARPQWTVDGPVDAARSAGKPLTPCGTPGAYQRHLAHHEPPCDPCQAAWRAKSTDTRRARRIDTTGPTPADAAAFETGRIYAYSQPEHHHHGGPGDPDAIAELVDAVCPDTPHAPWQREPATPTDDPARPAPAAATTEEVA